MSRNQLRLIKEKAEPAISYFQAITQHMVTFNQNLTIRSSLRHTKMKKMLARTGAP